MFSSFASLESKFKFLINKNDTIGKIIKIEIEKISQRFCQSIIVNQ